MSKVINMFCSTTLNTLATSFSTCSTLICPRRQIHFLFALFLKVVTVKQITTPSSLDGFELVT